MLSPSLVILSEAKDLGSSLRVNSAKHLGSFLTGARQMQGFFAPLRFTQNDRPFWIAPGLMTLSLVTVITSRRREGHFTRPVTGSKDE